MTEPKYPNVRVDFSRAYALLNTVSSALITSGVTDGDDIRFEAEAGEAIKERGFEGALSVAKRWVYVTEVE